MTEELNFKAICSLTTRVMGLEEGSLAYKNRTRKLQASRSIAGFIGLTEENISRKVVAKILDRDRTATYHYVRFHKKNLDKCEIYRDCFTKIYKEYKNIDGEKDIFVNKRHIGFRQKFWSTAIFFCISPPVYPSEMIMYIVDLLWDSIF